MNNLADSRNGTASSGDDIAVRFDAVTKRFGDATALREVSLSVRSGEFMTLLGPSGCGKTTLLNLAAGFFSPDGGEIRIDGARVNDVPTYRREIGMMFQNYALFPHMSVAENIAYGLKVRHIAKKERDRRVEEVLALVRLAGMAGRKPRQLSGGQQQRVALARALVISPKVLLLDEPFSALDKNLRASMQVELREIQRKLKVTTIFVTHDQGEALSLSDRVAVMSDGRIRQLGTPEEIYRRPCDRFVASFVGDANVLRGRLDGFDGAHSTVAVGTARVKVPEAPLRGVALSTPVDLFVRPEQLKIAEICAPSAFGGRVAAQVYQGGHVDLYIECAQSASDRLLVRSAGQDAMTRWPVGAEVGMIIGIDDAVAFPVP
ncbi:MAG: polyamine transporter ATP-binding protein [Tardiphaga sp.]|nr:polyamine transporter ATP-binding protein [Tardiphaga sp.]